MLYGHIFSRFAMDPPKGVLFYGPPGTGKSVSTIILHLSLSLSLSLSLWRASKSTSHCVYTDTKAHLLRGRACSSSRELSLTAARKSGPTARASRSSCERALTA